MVEEGPREYVVAAGVPVESGGEGGADQKGQGHGHQDKKR